MEGEVLEHLVSGRRYCVSIRFADTLDRIHSNFSQPVCAHTPGIFAAGTRTSTLVVLGGFCSWWVTAVSSSRATHHRSALPAVDGCDRLHGTVLVDQNHLPAIQQAPISPGEWCLQRHSVKSIAVEMNAALLNVTQQNHAWAELDWT